MIPNGPKVPSVAPGIEREGPNPSGLCMCGCGGRTALAASSNATYGWVRGQPRRFINAHSNRVRNVRHPPLTSRAPIVQEDGCWLWPGKRRPGSRAKTKTPKGRWVLIYRLLYEEYVGPIPDGMDLHHRCENPACVNPEHLEPMTGAAHASLHRNG